MIRRAVVLNSTFQELIDRADYLTGEQRQWAEARWLHETVSNYERSVLAERLHAVTTLVSVFAALAIPVAAGIAITDTSAGEWARPVTLVIGLIGAAAVAVNQIMRSGPRWRIYRTGYDELATEGWAYFNEAGTYTEAGPDGRFELGRETRFEKFFTRVEAIIAVRGRRYVKEVASLDETIPAALRLSDEAAR